MSVQKRKPQVGSVDPFIDFQHEKTDTMDTLLESYSAQEYIPSYIITPLIKIAFPSSSVLHSYSLEHLIVKVPIRELLSAPIMNWQYNRPADVPRCEDIAQYMVKSKKPVDTMIYISFNNKKKSFDVIDGIHRYTALTIIQEKTRHLDFLSSEFSGDMSWLIDSYILLNIRVNATEEELIGLFKALNKSNPIPDLYVRDVAKDKRQWIETLAARWQNRFKTHFSTTAKPNRPNVNRDRFMDLLNEVYDKHHLTEETKEKLETLLEKANVHISQNVPAKLTKAIREKCDLTGCWLFIYGTDDLVKMI